MDATIVVPNDEGTADVGAFISAGIKVYAGKLSEQQLRELLVAECYKRRAVLSRYDGDGEFVGLYVTFSSCDVEPDDVDEPGEKGQVYTDEHEGHGHLSYETRYTTLENPPGVCTYMLTSSWTEPDDGCSAESRLLTEGDAVRVREAITWLAERAGQEYGHASVLELNAEPSLTGDVDLNGIDEVVDELKLNSRYDEDPSFYGDERYGPFEERNAARGQDAPRPHWQ